VKREHVKNHVRVAVMNSDLPPLLDIDIDELTERMVNQAVQKGILRPGLHRVVIELSNGDRTFRTVFDLERRPGPG